MPQMAPLPWLSLMLFFIFTLYLFCSIVFYISTPSLPQFSSFSQKKAFKTWKW